MKENEDNSEAQEDTEEGLEMEEPENQMAVDDQDLEDILIDDIPKYDFSEHLIEDPAPENTKTFNLGNECLDWIKTQQNIDPGIVWIKSNLKNKNKIKADILGQQLYGQDIEKLACFKILFHKRAKMSLDKNNILVLKTESKYVIKHVIVLTTSMTNQILPKLHISSGTAHLGVDKTKEIFSQYFYTPFIHKKVSLLLKSCKACVYGKRLKPPLPPLGETNSLAHERLKFFAMDLIQLPESRNHYKYIFMVLEIGSLFIEAFPLKTKHANMFRFGVFYVNSPEWSLEG